MSRLDRLQGTELHSKVFENRFIQEELNKEVTSSRNNGTIDSKVVVTSFEINRLESTCNCKPAITLEGIIVVAICTLVALGFCVPIVIYVADTDHSRTSAIDLKFTNNCTDTSRQVSETQ